MRDNTHAPSDRSPTSFGHVQLHSPESVDYQLEIAGIGARSHAFVIDWHIRLLLALAWVIGAGFILSIWDQFKNGQWENAQTIIISTWLVPAAILFFLYHPVLEIAMSGRTPGKRMAGVRLVTLTGKTPGSGAILLRNIFRLVDSLPGFYGVGLACVALTKNQVRIGDLAAGLLLVYDQKISEKALQRATNLALHSHLSPADQTLLLELLERWPQLNDEVRIRLGEQFLRRIGHAVPEITKRRSTHSKAIRQRLKQLGEGEA